MENFESVKDHILKLASDYKCWDNRLTYDEALELCHVLEQEPCENAISRQAVLDINESHHGQIPNHINHQIWQEIKDLPPVTPQPKMGKWIKSRDSYGNNHFTCPFCENDIATKYDGAWKDNYCSNCGARMQEVE